MEVSVSTTPLPSLLPACRSESGATEAHWEEGGGGVRREEESSGELQSVLCLPAGTGGAAGSLSHQQTQGLEN